MNTRERENLGAKMRDAIHKDIQSMGEGSDMTFGYGKNQRTVLFYPIELKEKLEGMGLTVKIIGGYLCSIPVGIKEAKKINVTL